MTLSAWVTVITLLPIALSVFDRVKASWGRSDVDGWIESHRARLALADRLDGYGETARARHERWRADRELARRMAADEISNSVIRRYPKLSPVLAVSYLVVTAVYIVSSIGGWTSGDTSWLAGQVATAMVMLAIAAAWHRYTTSPRRTLRLRAQRIVRYRRSRVAALSP